MALPEHPYNWQPVPHSVFRDDDFRKELNQEGITVQPFLSPEQLESLRAIYEGTHSLTDEKGGMFYSVYSQDLAYRERVNEEVQTILQPTLDQWFVDYKNVINSFVIKLPGKASEFAIHQDTTALDEFKYSPLSIWIPLWDVDEENGAMCVIPGTHRLFSPYRGISFPFPFKNVNGEVRDYLKPVPVKAGEAVLFDPRILHNSLPNQSEKPRVALICGIFPSEARFRICFKENSKAAIEIYDQEDDFLLKYPNFLHHCHDRPVSGTVVDQVEDKFDLIDAPSFHAMMASVGAKAVQLLPPASEEACNMIAEPDEVDRNPLVAMEEVLATPVEAVASTTATKPGFFSRLFGKRS